jgi:periplasmic copper chaperone A
MRLLIALLCFAAVPALAQVQVVKAWARATPPGATVAAGYMSLRNNGTQADRLVSVTSPAAARVETHVTIRDGSISRMREVKGYEIPAGGTLELKPGGGHLMFVDVKAPFKQGDKVPVTLRFQRAGEVKAQLQVEGMGAMGTEHSSGMPGMKMH